MHRVAMALVGAITLLQVSVGLAAPADMGACAPLARKAAESTRALGVCTKERAAVEQKARSCAAQLEEEGNALADMRARAEAAQAARDRICQGAGQFVDGLTAGQLHANAFGACVTAEQKGQIAQRLASWRTVTLAVRALADYLMGETEAAPRAPSGTASEPERVLARLFGTGRSPLLYRRLLVEALHQIAPKRWRRLHAGGAAALNAWFVATSPLDQALVEEARSTAERGRPEVAAAAASTALELVRAYQSIVTCAEHPVRDCRRAAQLRELLETNGPLVMRRRTQDIWSFPCAQIGPKAVLAWLSDVPGGERLDFGDVGDAAFAKLYTCFIDDSADGTAFQRWLATRLPSSSDLTAAMLARLDRLRAPYSANPSYDHCARAVRALQTMSSPKSCALPDETASAIDRWTNDPSIREATLAPPLRACRVYARALWHGQSPRIPASFPRPPGAQELVELHPGAAGLPMQQLREACGSRRGSLRAFPAALARIADLAAGFGESVAASPWRLDHKAGRPIEAARLGKALRGRGWLRHLVTRQSACEALGVGAQRCQTCTSAPHGGPYYHCALIRMVASTWAARTRILLGSGASLASLILFVVWGLRLRREIKSHGAWARQSAEALSAIEVTARPSRLRYLTPRRFSLLHVELPAGAAWERWGRRAVVVRADAGSTVRDRDVNRAAALAKAEGAQVALLIHDEGAAPDLSAVRALLDWAARGGHRAVQVLPLSMERLRWARSADDLLDLVEQSSLRGNPFDVRGRITSSSQFFDRERLVSGLLAGVQAGHWLVVTGLRRFGKSSLALEVARRLPGPSAYVDLAGFYHEIVHVGDPARAADAILGYLCLQLLESSRRRWPRAALPDPPKGALGAAELASWLRAFAEATREAAGGRPSPLLVILDEVEQAIGVGPERLAHALDVLSIVVGRLRSAMADPTAPPGGGRIGVLLCSALHPLLWAPLATLAHQSLMGAFASVCVSRLDGEAGMAMLRALGVRQGIRFADAAAAYLVDQAAGVPLLVRRLASSVLELYDADRARQGALGALDVGIEGARAAVRREEAEGSPFRVWVESEIAEPTMPAGIVLRHLAQSGSVSADHLRAIAQAAIAEQFAQSGVDKTLSAEESLRRTQEAASVLIRLLADTGLLQPHGDLTRPDAYELGDTALRRVLRRPPARD